MNVAPDIMETFLDLQMKKALYYVILKIEEKQKQVIVEKTWVPTESYDDFSFSPENDYIYALYDFDLLTGTEKQDFLCCLKYVTPNIMPKSLEIRAAGSECRLKGICFDY